MQFALDVTLADDADPEQVADQILDLLLEYTNTMDPNAVPGVVSFDGCETA